MHKLYFIITLICISLNMTSYATTVRFNITDENGDLLVGATAVMFSMPDSVFVDYSVTDSNGYIELNAPDSDWYIDISSVGFDSKRISKSALNSTNSIICPHDISTSGQPVNIVLRNSSTQLKEVVVKAERGYMTMKNGIISYNNLKGLISQRVLSNAYELLSAFPLITTNDGNRLSLTGAPLGSVIYINGRAPQMTADELTGFLKNTPAEMIEGVDIIYTPQPKWKTKSSIINIRMKGPKPYSWSGAVNTSLTERHTYSSTLGTTVFAGLPKFDFYCGYIFNPAKTIKKETSIGHHTVSDKIFNVSDTTILKSLTRSHNIYGAGEYHINKTKTISLNYTGSFSPRKDSDSKSLNSIYGIYDSDKDASRYFNGISITYSDTKGIEAGADYSHFNNKQTQTIWKNDRTVPVLTGISTQKVNHVKVYIDLTTGLPKNWELTYGCSYEQNANHNRLDNNSADSDMTGDNRESRTDESIVNIYLGTRKIFMGGKLTIQASLKGEVYKIGHYKHNQLLPTAVATFIPNYTHIFQLSYQSYRTYPSMWQRQDYTSYSNPYQCSEGNPLLKPSTYNIGSLLYLLKQKYTFTLGYYRVSDFFLNQSYQSPDALVLISKPYNIDFSSLLDFTATIPVSIKKKFYSTISLTCSFERFKSSDWHNLAFDKSRFGGAIMLDNNLIISTKPKIAINITGMYKLPSLAGLWERKSAWLLNAGISGSFLSDRLTVALKSFDLLEKLHPMEQMRHATQWLDVNGNYYSRSFSLSVSFRFKGYKERKSKETDTSRYGIE